MAYRARISIETIAKDLPQWLGKEVCLCGWVSHRRSSGKIRFLEIRDGSGRIQCIASPKDCDEKSFLMMDTLPQESSVCVRGTVREDKRSPIGFEIGLKELQVLAEAKDFPISNKEHGTGFLMDQRHLWLRSQRQWAIMR